MSVNQRVEYNYKDNEDFLQNAPSKASRTEFTPGKKTSKPLDQNWPIEFDVKTGNSFVDTYGITHNRVVKLGRNSICDVALIGIEEGTDRDADIYENERRTGYDTVVL